MLISVAVMSTRKQTILSILIPAIVSLIPAFFTYSQSMYEVRQKYKQSHVEAEAGYASLVTSVKELQEYSKDQHDQLIKLQAYLSAMELFMNRTASATGPARVPAAARVIVSANPSSAIAKLRPANLQAPDLTEPAADFDAAAKPGR